MTPRFSVLIGAMTYIPWVWSSQNSVGCSLIGTFICSSVFPSLQHVFTLCLMCSWCGIQLWTKLATPPLWQSSLAFSSQNAQQRQRQGEGNVPKCSPLWRSRNQAKGLSVGLGESCYFIFNRATAGSTEAGRGAPWCQWPTFAHSIQLRSPTLGVDRFSVFPPSHAVDAKKRDTVSVLFT